MVERAEPCETESLAREAGHAAEANGSACPRPQIRQLVLDHYSSVYRYAFRLSGHADDAEDLTQQTFLIAHRKLYQLRETDKVIRWLFAILRSAYLKSVRKQRPVAAVNLDLDVDNVPDDAIRRGLHEEVDTEQLQAALDEMPDEFKLVLVMFYFEDRSYKEIAAALEIPMGTVMSRLSRAKGTLRQRLFHPRPNRAKERETNQRPHPAATRTATD